MRISKINIKNFRSIQEAEFDCSEFNIFVGQNNSGKTNLFEAIEWFFKGLSKGKSITDLYLNKGNSKEISVEVLFLDALHGAENMRNEANKTKILKALDE